MSDSPKKAPVPAKPPGSAEKSAAEQSTEDGLQAGRKNTNSRQEVLEQKTPQGQPNRG
jgi:hypothetical protein